MATLTLPATRTDGLAAEKIVINTKAAANISQASAAAASAGGPNALYTDLAISQLYGNNDAKKALWFDVK